MARKNPLVNGDRSPTNPEVVVSQDNKSLLKGRRVAPRTDVCRPVLMWDADKPDQRHQGVVLDLNPHGLRIRMLEIFPIGTQLFLQMMRDDNFEVPLSHPIPVQVVRMINSNGFYDHGVKLLKPKIRRPAEFRPVQLDNRRERQGGSRMHILDVAIDDKGLRRPGRYRG